MKKLVFGIFLVSVVAKGFTSCKKDLIQNDKNNSSNVKSSSGVNSLYEVKNNMLVIPSVEAFDSIIKMTDDNLIREFNALNYVSYSEEVGLDSLNTIEDEFLSSVLNKDQAIQIGNYIYRINKSSSKVFVISRQNIKSYSDLISENTINKDVLEFSTEDNVFDLLNEYENKDEDKALSNNCQSSKQNNNGGWNEYADFIDVNNIYQKGTDKRYKFSVYLIVRYDNWGIYRKLFTEFKHKKTMGNTWDQTFFSFGYQVSYLAKNGDGGADDEFPAFAFALNPNYTGTGNYSYTDNRKEIIHYRATKCLKSYDLKSWVWYRDRETLKPKLYPNGGNLRINS